MPFLCVPLFVAGCTGQLIDGSQLFTQHNAPGGIAQQQPIVIDPMSATANADLAAALGQSRGPGASKQALTAESSTLLEGERKSLTKPTADASDGLVRLFNGETAPDGPVLLYPTGQLWQSRSPNGTVPKSLRNEPLMDVLINNFVIGYAPGGSRPKSTSKLKATRKKLSKDDLTQFIEETYNYLGVGSVDSGPPGAESSTDQKQETFNRILRYYIVYAQGNFIDRQGTSLSAPKVQEGKLSDAAISGALEVFIEAVADSSFRLPVFYKVVSGKQVWILSNNENSDKEPTCALLDSGLTICVDGSDPKNKATMPQNIDATDIRLVHYLVRMAGRQGEFLSGLLFRSIGKVDGGQFVFAGVSIGDNQLLSTLVDIL